MSSQKTAVHRSEIQDGKRHIIGTGKLLADGKWSPRATIKVHVGHETVDTPVYLGDVTFPTEQEPAEHALKEAVAWAEKNPS